jgi:hypothetical protein
VSARRRAPFAALAIAVGTASAAHAQTSTRDASLHRFFTYGLDAQQIRLDRIQRVSRIDGRPYVRTIDAGDGHVGYLLLTLTVKNSRAKPAPLPTLVSTVTTNAGPAIAPSTAGPFLGDETTQVTPQTAIPAHALATIHLALVDIPNGHAVTQLILSPNDATAQYRFRLKPSDVTTLAPVPR